MFNMFNRKNKKTALPPEVVTDAKLPSPMARTHGRSDENGMLSEVAEHERLASEGLTGKNEGSSDENRNLQLDEPDPRPRTIDDDEPNR